MLTREEYGEYLKNPQLESEALKEGFKETNDFVRNAKHYEKYTSSATQNLAQDYGREIAFLNYLNDTNPNSLTTNQQDALQEANEAVQTLSKEEQRAKEEELSLRLIQKKHTQAGYLNATILIFVVLNFGFFIAALLLIAQ